MTQNHYAEMSQIQLQATFQVAGVNTDPTTVSCKVLDSTGAVASYTLAGGTVTRDSTGIYHVIITNAIAGVWWHRWEAGGAVIAASEASWLVDPSLFYTT